MLLSPWVFRQTSQQQVDTLHCTLPSFTEQGVSSARGASPAEVSAIPLPRMQHPLSEQGEACAPIHHPFDQLQAVDLAFSRAVAVVLAEARFHCRLVLRKPSAKAL